MKETDTEKEPIKNMLTDTIETDTAEAENYLDTETGLLFCGKCHTKKQRYITYLGIKKKIACLCHCQAEAVRKEQQRRKTEEQMLAVSRLKSAGLQDKAFYQYTFDSCDRSHSCYGYARQYVEHFKEFQKNGQGLLFWGNVGTGKTFLAACIANALMEQNIPVLMTSFPKLLNALGGLYSEERNHYLQSLNQYRLLVIDDLGVERETSFVLETVYLVIDERYKSGKPSLITTNLSLQTLKSPMDLEHGRIYGRILEKCVPVAFSGKNYREEKGQETREVVSALLRQ